MVAFGTAIRAGLSPEFRKPTGTIRVPKITRTAERDREHLSELAILGWEVLTVWECELKDMTLIENRLKDFLEFKHATVRR